VPTVLGKSLASSQEHVQRTIGEMHVSLSAARALLYETARFCTEPGADRAEIAARVAAAKYAVTHASCQVTELALRVAGGFSLTRRFSLERHFRDARGGLFEPLQDDLALGLVGRSELTRAR
jgi:alkylation response protein AidB-like acyl-CoA dehydrogenase